MWMTTRPDILHHCKRLGNNRSLELGNAYDLCPPDGRREAQLFPVYHHYHSKHHSDHDSEAGTAQANLPCIGAQFYQTRVSSTRHQRVELAEFLKFLPGQWQPALWLYSPALYDWQTLDSERSECFLYLRDDYDLTPEVPHCNQATG